MVITYKTEDKDSNLMEQLQKFFMTENKPTAIVCYNDQLALQVIVMLRELGLNIPEDVSIVG
jgi:GntR family transcriptional regulator of arabinose operon